MTLTVDQLRDALGISESRAVAWQPHIAFACSLFAIDNPERLSAFLAQIGHESGRLRYVREIWGPTPAQRRYEGRADLGNTEPGDGRRFAGHGLIQTTGRANHAATRDGLAQYLLDVPDFEAQPEALEQMRWAALSAAWYWHRRGLNALADESDFERITRRVNGGLNGYEDRLALWDAARAALGALA